jgi:predicted acylesterase/phospholipase RssA
MEPTKPKIGVALSGGAGRSAAHFAVLDVLIENGIQPEIIVGCSSGALVAAAYAVGTRDYMFGQFKTMTKKRLWSFLKWRGARGGLFSLNGANTEFMKLTKGRRIEELPVKLGITAADIENGELVAITTGDITPALKAAVAIPGLFEPVVFNNRILLEGGLVNIVPAVSARQLGADIVIGVDVAKTKFFFQKKMGLFRLIRRWRRIFGIDLIQQGIIKPITTQTMDALEKQFKIKKRRVPNALRIFFWAVDRSYDVEQEWNEEKRNCDIMISPPVTETAKLELSQAQQIYDEGRKSALAALPQIKRLIEDFGKQ